MFQSNRLRRIADCAVRWEERLLEGHKFQPDMCGYDTGDPWLDDAHSAEELQAGSPVVLIGSRQTGTYVATIAGTQNLHNIRHNGSALVLEVSRDSFVPLPTEPPAVVDPAVATKYKK